MKDTQKSIREEWTAINNQMLWTTATEDEEVADWWLAKFSSLLQTIESEIEGERKYHKEFECNGAHGGKGCFETFCEDQNCRNAPKEFNSGLDSAKAIISKYKEI